MAVNSTWWGGAHYSEDEQIIGTWIDNKPLYQKVFDIGSSAVSNGYVDVSSLNISCVAELFGVCQRNTVQWLPVQARTESPDYNNYGIRLTYTADDKRLTWGIYGYTASEINHLYITIRYTKTTD